MSKVVQALTIAFEFVGQKIDEYAIAEMAADLQAYPEAHVLSALKRCRQELRSIKFIDIVDRLPGGHPGPEEAWALISQSMQNEAISIVWTDEMREAAGVAFAVQDDKVAARMAFKEAYTRIMGDARAKQKPPHWSASLGWDANGREIAQIEAQKRNNEVQGLAALPAPDRLTLPHSGALLPMPADVRAVIQKIGKHIPNTGIEGKAS
ncbi:MAG: hypothetical protein OJF50_002478 [Nitrospira sp.]|jgi:hypothetical protein|nr:hypothetical protein [Nitrospira sp.]